uniref:KAT8 regulatory NSL complex subunit 2 n=1 Tax=Globodera pallida TaxID=36090 RepID=A0A183C8H5_GLOPA
MNCIDSSNHFLDQHMEVDYQQPSSSSNLGNSPIKAQILEGPTVVTERITIPVLSTTKKSNAHFCEFVDQIKGQCKQRAINTFKYCIRHILFDPTAPYKQCQHQRKPKNKHDKPVLCTNAIRAACMEIYCSTHLIMNGLKDPKVSTKKDKANLKGLDKDKSAEHSEKQKINGTDDFDGVGGGYPPVTPSDRVDLQHLPLNSQTISSNLIRTKNNDALYYNQQMDKSRMNLIPNLPPDVKPPYLESDDLQFIRNREDNLAIKRVPNEDFPAYNLSKTHPQLAAKLLQSRPLGQQASEVPPGVQANEKVLIDNSRNILNQPPSNVSMDVCFPTDSSAMPSPNNIYHHHQYTSSTAFVSPPNHERFPKPFTNEQQNNFLHSKYEANGIQLREEPIGGDSVLHRVPQQPPPRAVVASHKEFVQSPCTYVPSSLAFLNSNPPPRRYDLNRLERRLNQNACNEHFDLLEFQRERDFSFNESIQQNGGGVLLGKKRLQKVIKLRQKRQKVLIDGAFRAIPMVDTMCRIVESQDFDRTDLFPLGLEPSDDESSDDSFPSLGEENSRLELYLLKKQLRLESSRLVQRAKLCVPINTTAREYKNSVGAALRVRRNNSKRENIREQQKRLLRCSFTSQQQTQLAESAHVDSVPFRCTNVSLPWSRHCAEHVTYNVAQQLFSFCKWRLCNESVPITDLVLFDGLCRRHYYTQQRQQLTAAAAEQPQRQQHNNIIAPNCELRPSSAITCQDQSLKKSGHYFQQYRAHCGGDSLSSATIRCEPFDGHHVHFGPNSVPVNRDDHLNETMDVSLASVAKDLGFDGHDLTDMLAKLPVEEGFEGDMDPDEDLSPVCLGSLTDINKEDSDEAPLDHAWPQLGGC